MVTSQYERTQAMASAVELIVNPFRGRTELMTEKDQQVPPDMQKILEQIKINVAILEYTRSVDLGTQVVKAIMRAILHNTLYTISRDGQVQVLA